jgi:hypothetical protein
MYHAYYLRYSVCRFQEEVFDNFTLLGKSMASLCGTNFYPRAIIWKVVCTGPVDDARHKLFKL